MVRPERFELPTPRFVVRYSVQLSHGCMDAGLYLKIPSEMAGSDQGVRVVEMLKTHALP